MKVQNLAKFMAYMLGVDPTEFGLVPDAQNRYKIKDVLKALNELEGYRGVRLGDLAELTLTLENPAVTITDGFIAATDTARLAPKVRAVDLPKILYTAVRGKAHAHVMREGVTPAGAPYVLMSPHKDTALKIGRRIDSAPVIIEVRPHLCMSEGVEIYAVGCLFIADYLPPGVFIAPPLPKEPLNRPKAAKPKPRAEAVTPPLTPGSFFLDLHEEAVSKEEKQRRVQKDKQLKKERKSARKQKHNRLEGYE